MAKERWKLTEEQKAQIIEWLAIFPSNRDIHSLMKKYEMPSVSDTALTYYRNKYAEQSDVLKERFRLNALERGWALKEARVQLLEELLRESVEGADVKTTLAIEKQLSERVDEPSLQRLLVEFEEPKTMEELMKGLVTNET